MRVRDIAEGTTSLLHLAVMAAGLLLTVAMAAGLVVMVVLVLAGLWEGPG